MYVCSSLPRDIFLGIFYGYKALLQVHYPTFVHYISLMELKINVQVQVISFVYCSWKRFRQRNVSLQIKQCMKPHKIYLPPSSNYKFPTVVVIIL